MTAIPQPDRPAYRLLIPADSLASANLRALPSCVPSAATGTPLWAFHPGTPPALHEPTLHSFGDSMQARNWLVQPSSPARGQLCVDVDGHPSGDYVAIVFWGSIYADLPLGGCDSCPTGHKSLVMVHDTNETCDSAALETFGGQPLTAYIFPRASGSLDANAFVLGSSNMSTQHQTLLQNFMLAAGQPTVLAVDFTLP